MAAIPAWTTRWRCFLFLSDSLEAVEKAYDGLDVNATGRKTAPLWSKRVLRPQKETDLFNRILGLLSCILLKTY